MRCDEALLVENFLPTNEVVPAELQTAFDPRANIRGKVLFDERTDSRFKRLFLRREPEPQGAAFKRSRSTSRRRRIFPEGDLGISSRNSTSRIFL